MTGDAGHQLLRGKYIDIVNHAEENVPTAILQEKRKTEVIIQRKNGLHF